MNPLLAVAALGAEALWLLYAPDSRRLRHLLWDPRFEQVEEALLAQERADRMALLDEPDRERVEVLIDRQHEIRRLAATNPSFTGELQRAELIKTDRLVEAFLDLSVTCTRYEQYLASIDLPALERDRTRFEVNSKTGAPDDPQVEVARKNLAIVLKRLDKMKEIRRYLTVARGQLDLIENSFAPSGDPAFQADADRAAIVTLHRWSFLPEIERGDNVVILIAENLTDLSPTLVSNPKVATIPVPMPDPDTRRAVVRIADPKLPDRDVERYADMTAGLKAIQIASILSPPPPAGEIWPRAKPTSPACWAAVTASRRGPTSSPF
jgi:hypothetical protein